MSNVPVNSASAKACADNYISIYKNSTDKNVAACYTETVQFNRADLIAYLQGLTTDSIKIKLGVYTAAFVAQYPSAIEGRLTVFIKPFNSLTAVSPSNAVEPDDDGGGDPLNTGTLVP